MRRARLYGGCLLAFGTEPEIFQLVVELVGAEQIRVRSGTGALSL